MKIRLGDLAVLGGTPAFKEPRHVGRPNVFRREAFIARVEDMFERRWLTNDGPYVQELERTLERILGVAHCVAVSNATIGMAIAARAIGLTGEVIVPAFTFVATPHVLEWHGITPVFADADPATHNLDPACVKQLITSRTTGVLGVHVWGRPCAIDELTDLTDRYGLALLFDAGHAFAGSHQGRMLGNFGRAEIFSFHATKFVHSFEGGAIATNDTALATRVARMRNFGFGGSGEVTDVGINGKMSEVAAAMGLTSLESLDEIVAVNRHNHEMYRARLSRVPGLRVAQYDSRERANYQYVVAEVDAAEAGISRDVLHKALLAEGVLARRYFHPGCHRMEPYRSLPRYRDLHLPVTERLAERVLCLPTGIAMSPGNIDEVCDIIEICMVHGPELSSRIHDPSLTAKPAIEQ
jgi:dTDP-4-amino-4,6-dideoxygalactose transaminase